MLAFVTVFTPLENTKLNYTVAKTHENQHGKINFALKMSIKMNYERCFRGYEVSGIDRRFTSNSSVCFYMKEQNLNLRGSGCCGLKITWTA